MTLDVIDLIEHIKNFPPSPHRRMMWETRSLTEITYLLIHHTAGPEEATPLEIHESQRNRDFGTPGGPAYAPRVTYHYLINPLGATYKCNKAEWVTWHCPGKNWTGLSICLVGNRSLLSPPALQYASLIDLARTVMSAYTIPLDRVAFHRTYFATACPGAYMNLDAFRAAILATDT